MASTFRSVNPARPADVVGEFEHLGPAQVAAAIERGDLAQRDWASAPARERAALIGGVAHAIARRTREFAALITREEGKTLAESEAETHKAVEQFHFASQLCYLAEGTTFPAEQPGVFSYTLRSPLGVVVAITPWNFPVSLPARKIGAALAAGNAVVFKPSPVTAATAELLTRTIHEAGVPAGLVQLVQGDDPAAMAELVSHRLVRAVSLTGSGAVGERVRAAMRGPARLQAELSGHNAAVVCADADLPAAARECVQGALGLSGQACTAASRVLVEQAVFGEFAALVAERVAAMRCGPGDAPGVTAGPVATPAQFERLDALARSARSAGARVLAGAALEPERDPAGYFLAPLALTATPAGHDLLTREVFGPLLTLAPVAGLDEAIGVVNGSGHGLVAAVHTTSLGAASRFARQARCGIVKVNQRSTGNGVAPPFGGWKESGTSAFPEGGAQALAFFTEVKAVYQA